MTVIRKACVIWRTCAAVMICSLCCNQPLQAEPPAADADPSTPSLTAEQRKFVEQKVLPLLQARCFECHSQQAEEPGGSLLLTGRAAMLTGGDSGPAIVPGKPEESLMIEAVRYESFEMPPRTKMPDQEIELLVQWIRDGAPWPQELDTAAPAPAKTAFPLQERRQAHWAWHSIQRPEIPDVQQSGWPATATDQFVLSRLQTAGLDPVQDADRRTLVRRLYFDLIGLPPTLPQVEAFVSHPGDIQTAVTELVDELLASPHFGERWGRHWLDLVRYAETLGHEFDFPLPDAWQYRDYVIRALNADVPYDQFLQEHVAGDLLEDPRRHPTQQFNESVLGTGFWFLGEDKHAPVDVRGEEAARIDNQIDVFSKAFLGLTVACARCHDHKFDAISTADYYALAGFLQSSRRTTAWLDPEQKITQARHQLRKLQRESEARVDSMLQQADYDFVQSCLQASVQIARGQDLTAVAAETGIDPEILTRWVKLLQQADSAKLDHPLSLPATLARQADRGSTSVVTDWRNAVTGRQSLTDSDTTLLADLRQGVPADWFTTGPAFADARQRDIHPETQPTGDGDPAHGSLRMQWTAAGPKAVTAATGVSSAELSPQLTGTLTSPTFALSGPELLIRVAGANTRCRLVIDGYVMHEFSELLFKGARQQIDTDGASRWIRMAQDVHRYQGHRAWLEFLDEGDGWFQVQEIRVASRAGASPPLPEIPGPTSLQLAERLQPDASVASVAAAWAAAAKQLPECQALLINHQLIPGTDNPQFQQAQQAWQTTASELPDPVTAMVMTDGTPEDESVFIRGNHLNLGETAERSFLEAISGSDQPAVADGSGRLELSRRMLAEDNPFPARVAVNRIWQHLFGVGLVATSDNFGVLGQTPSHPELLDFLADEFRRDGWSVKRMIRRLATSRTYRLSSRQHEAAAAQDPTNRLLSRANIRRLQGEAVRDAMLQVSGSLQPVLYGEPVPVYLTDFMQGRGRPDKSGPLDGNGRRSIYLSVNRNFLSPFMLAFDVPAPVTTISDRGTSNVPAQALILLNNDFVAQMADRWATRLLETDRSLSETLQHAWQQAYARPADPETVTQLQNFMAAQAAQRNQSLDDPAAVHQALADVCHVLFNSKEFLFLN